ncbi:X-ray repair cross-complementing protein 5 [Ixodes scapularis]|uniref:X-ray repair cross-complementing protein 5 n=1 Tax=Ixodes scapularis TaxID=6945 RepID=UPI001C38FFE3|nr:X-ray repair cross-complementing protein 5 [Ixodes scapularis]
MAANKEAVVIILDVGPHMNQGAPGKPSDLEEAKTCAELMIQRRIFSESKDEIALVVCGSQKTNNSLSSDNEYTHIDVVANLQPVSFGLLEKLGSVKSTQHTCDFVDAVVVALDVLMDQTKNQKFAGRKVVLLSNLGGAFDDSQQNVIANGMKNSSLSLTVVCPFDIENGVDDTAKLSPSQRKAVGYVSKILKTVEGDAYTFSQAVPALTTYEKKRVRPTPWNANLEIGPDLSIPISSYIKISEAKPKTWKQCVAQRPDVPVRCDATLYRNDEKETEVEKAETVAGYRYGTTLVPFSDEDRDSLECTRGGRGLQVLGFTDAANIKRHYYMGDKTSYVLARKGDESAEAAMSALIQALDKSKMVAIVRYAFSERSSPRMGFLSPRIKDEYECLVFVQLPYMEDLRRFTFAPLDANKDNIPTEEQLSVFDDLIAAMDLSEVEVNGEPQELFKSSQTCNPYLQRFYQCVQHRALHPKDPLPEVAPHVADALKPPKAITELARPVLEKMASLFPLHEVVPEKRKQDNTVTKNGGGTVTNASVSSDEPAAKKSRADFSMADLVATATTKVDVVNPVEDFKKLLADKDHRFDDVCSQLEGVILKLFDDTLGRAVYAKAVRCLRAYREASLEKSNPGKFNDFMNKLKSLYSIKREELWELLIKEAVQPVGKAECSKSALEDDEVKRFYVVEKEAEEKKEDEPKDEDDLLDMM